MTTLWLQNSWGWWCPSELSVHISISTTPFPSFSPRTATLQTGWRRFRLSLLWATPLSSVRTSFIASSIGNLRHLTQTSSAMRNQFLLDKRARSSCMHVVFVFFEMKLILVSNNEEESRTRTKQHSRNIPPGVCHTGGCPGWTARPCLYKDVWKIYISIDDLHLFC